MTISCPPWLPDDRAFDPLVAITSQGRRHYQAFRGEVLAHAAALAAKGCRAGALICQDNDRALVGFCALLYLGADVVLLPSAQPGAVVKFAHAFDWLVTDAPMANLSFHDLTAPPSAGRPIPAAAILQSRVRLYTSGSMGEPKQEIRTPEELLREAATMEAVFGPELTNESVFFATVTHRHLYGLTFAQLWPLVAGRPLHATSFIHWEPLLQEMTPGAVLITSPAHLHRLAGLAPLPEDRRPALVFSSGAPLSESAAREAEMVFGRPVIETYGSTETGGMAWRRRDTVDPPWQPYPGVELALDKEGILRVQTPFAAGGNWITTSDLAAKTPTGHLRLLGRKDRIVKIDGKRVSLTEVTTEIRRLPGVVEVAVVLLPGDNPRLGAVVVQDDQGRADLASLGPFRLGQQMRHALAPMLEPASRPRQWRFVSQFPMAPLGKRRDQDLIALFAPPLLPTLRAIQNQENGVTLELFIDPELLYLQGHFPEMPICPGVALLHWARCLAADHLGQPFSSIQGINVKFRRLILAGATVALVLQFIPTGRQLRFEYRSLEGESLSVGTLTCREAIGCGP